MVTVTQAFDGSLLLKSNYVYSQRLKNIPGARWNPELKVWNIPVSSMETFENMFKGEYYYKTPRWVIRNEPAPNMTDFYKVPEVRLEPITKPYGLYNYQKYGARFAIDRIGRYNFAIISDGCGLGKTLQAIQVMLNYYTLGARNFIIVCKKSAKTQWHDEIRKFAPTFAEPYPITIIEGTAAKRRKQYDYIQSHGGIMILNYQAFLNDEAMISGLKNDFCVIDEAHVVSTYKTKTNTAIRNCVSKIPTLYLTGTPILSNPEQIFGIISINNSDYFNMNYTQFKNKYVVYNNNGRYTAPVGVKNLDELRKKVQKVIIRRTEYEVAVELPETIEKRIVCLTDKTQRELYKAIGNKGDEYEERLTRVKKDIDEALRMNNTNKVTTLKAEFESINACMKALISARQACADDPYMFHYTNSKFLRQNFEKFVPVSYRMSSKVETTIEIIQEIADSGEKVIVFSKFVTSLMILYDEIMKLKITPLMYTGQQNAVEREYVKKTFQNDSSFPVLLGSEAMAESLNFQVANHVINFNVPDTAAIYTQRIGRVRRVGSAFKKVHVYNMITDGSVDETRWEHLIQTQQLDDAFISADASQRKALKEVME